MTEGKSSKHKIWECDMCKISTNGEQSFVLHMKGRKHKARERLILSAYRNKVKTLEKDVTTVDNFEKEKQNVVLSTREMILPNCKSRINENKWKSKEPINEETSGKNSRNEMRYGLCQTLDICEMGLEVQLKGKEPKEKEKLLLLSTNKSVTLAPNVVIKLSKEDVMEIGKNGKNEEKTNIPPATKKDINFHEIEAAMTKEKSSKPKSRWKCDLCEIRTTGEQSFVLHMKGRRHKAREMLLLSPYRNKVESVEKDVTTSGNFEKEVDNAVFATREMILPQCKSCSNENKWQTETSVNEDISGKHSENEKRYGPCQTSDMSEICIQLHLNGNELKEKEKLLKLSTNKNDTLAPKVEMKLSKEDVIATKNYGNKEGKTNIPPVTKKDMNSHCKSHSNENKWKTEEPVNEEILGKNSRNERRYRPCQASDMCEMGLDLQLKGNELKEKEKLLLLNNTLAPQVEMKLSKEDVIVVGNYGKKERKTNIPPSTKEDMNSHLLSGIQFKSHGTSITDDKREEVKEGITEKKSNTNLKSEWRCALCRIYATCEEDLDDHMKGRKHKAKEMLLLSTQKNMAEVPDVETKSSIELMMTASNYEEKKDNSLVSNKEDTHPRPPVVKAPSAVIIGGEKCYTSPLSAVEKKRIREEPESQEKGEDNITPTKKKLKNEWRCDLCLIVAADEKSLEKHMKGIGHGAAEKLLMELIRKKAQKTEQEINYLKTSVLAAGSNQEKEEEKLIMNSGSEAKFWCKMCSFGTDTEEMMTRHEKGERHMTLLKQNGGCVIVIKTIPDN